MNQNGAFLEAGLLIGATDRIDLGLAADLVDKYLSRFGHPTVERMSVSRTEKEIITRDFALLLYVKLPELREETDEDGQLVEIEPDAPEVVVVMDVFAADDSEDAELIDPEPLMAGIVDGLARHVSAHTVRWLDPATLLPTDVFCAALGTDADSQAEDAFDWAAMGDETLASVARTLDPTAMPSAEAPPILLLDKPIRDEADLALGRPHPRDPADAHFAAVPAFMAKARWARVRFPLAHGAGLAATALGFFALVNAPRMASALDAATGILP
ncbi:hypothetical protein R5H30_01775 [Sulfitobacter sp. D35]|uniref:hypothetical protein n=1 Tax=Sulfitobacter sp. D35 TaxID=3083252 RepID=UPI00296F9DEB|nr:hypothetical protein [Sulfitobacter sp. D35]MDW4496694.1 hypothetical protein [Sulfitobacter sp. D35]